MATVGVIIFYIGFFGLIIGIGTAIRGKLEIIRINNRKEALYLVLMSFAIALAGLIIIGPGHSV